MAFGASMVSGLAVGLVLHVVTPGLVGGDAPDFARLLSPQPIGVWQPNAEGLEFRADHASAMTQQRWKGEGQRLWRRDMPFEVPFLWVAQDGSSIRRTGDGLFRLTLATPHRDWFFETQCHAAGWPMFYCTDGRERQMSAPDLSTTIFDDIAFRRVMPTQSAASEAAPEVDPAE